MQKKYNRFKKLEIKLTKKRKEQKVEKGRRKKNNKKGKLPRTAETQCQSRGL